MHPSAKTLRARGSFLALGAGALFAASASPRASAAEFELKCGSNEAPGQPSSVRLYQMWKTIETESGGRLRVQFYPASQLGGDASMFSQLRLGALHFLFISTGSLASVVPAADIGSVGFAFKDSAEALRTMDGALGAYIRQEVAAKGLYAFRGFWLLGLNTVGSNTHPIHNPDDLHGFKIRTSESKILVDLFRTLGATPSPINFGDVYTALQTKLIDGESAPLVAIEGSRFYEVNKYVSLTNHSLSGDWLIGNGDVWKRLPPDLQALVERNHAKYTILERRDAKLLEASLAGRLTRQGLTMNALDLAPFRAPLRPYYQTWSAAFGATEWNLLESSLGHRLG